MLLSTPLPVVGLSPGCWPHRPSPGVTLGLRRCGSPDKGGGCWEELFLVGAVLAATGYHIVLVGTSVLRNALRRLEAGSVGGCVAPEECREVLAACADPSRLDRGRCREGIGACMEFLRCMVEQDPAGMSAELNAMDWVLGSGCSGVSGVVLLASDTPEGEAAARVLDEYLSTRGCPSRVRVVRGLGSDAGFWPGLVELARVVAEEARGAYAMGHFIYLNATGGFKPESGFAVLAATAVAPVSAYYKHEAMKETVLLPMIPVAVDAGRMRAIVSKLELAAVPGKKLDPGDPQLEDIRWVLHFLAKTGVLRDEDGLLVVDEKAADIMSLIARVYEAILGELG